VQYRQAGIFFIFLLQHLPTNPAAIFRTLVLTQGSSAMRVNGQRVPIPPWQSGGPVLNGEKLFAPRFDIPVRQHVMAMQEHWVGCGAGSLRIKDNLRNSLLLFRLCSSAWLSHSHSAQNHRLYFWNILNTPPAQSYENVVLLIRLYIDTTCCFALWGNV